MGQTNFEKLRVYQLAEQLADLIWKIVIKWNFFEGYDWEADCRCG